MGQYRSSAVPDRIQIDRKTLLPVLIWNFQRGAEYGDPCIVDQYRRFSDLVKSLNLQDCVTFYGARQHSFVSDLLKSADIFLLPSKTASDGDMEGIPVSLMESMATGLITLSTYHSGIPELIEHGEDGFLVPEGSPESIAAQIENIISNKSEINTLQERAICKVKEKFNQETLYDDLLNVLRGGSWIFLHLQALNINTIIFINWRRVLSN